MNKIKLNNSIEIPNIAFGVGRISNKLATDTTYLAIKNGFRLIDSSRGYGNQKEVGEAVKKAVAEGIVNRSDLILTQKLAGSELGYDNAMKIFNDGCEYYGTDYIDIMLVYLPLEYTPYWKRGIIDSWRAMEKLYKEGKVKAIGVSNFQVEHLVWLLNYAEIKPMINQIEVHPYYQQRLVTAFCQNNNIQIEAWSSLMYVVNNNLLKELGNKYKKSSAQIALKWSQQKGYIPICSSKIENEIIQNLNLDDFELSSDDIERIDSLDGGMHSIDNQARPPINVDQLLNECASRYFYRSINYTRVYNLLGFIPILKETKYRWNKTKWFLFGCIPILKIKTKEYKKIRKDLIC